ncbi:polysaccharide biosynthesis tyrosine autokinase [Phormidium sp. LEGE 05292]|uniref:GumC family protein n=1 Tax=[Phormidium] sp. LEGE 05292 TaxID=767427 RepID=UPI00187E85DA|nr:tyrosine-protein kinase family protein [Phormidium sp. LEGE 05292]MBE9223920.1 polysaccharide biosynthesis tyrosine autokinase [Phormidium sp. LEGE 05292]
MESTETSTGLQHYWLIIKRRWQPASFVFMLVVVLCTLITFREKPVYEAVGKLSFKKISPTSSLTGLGKEIGEVTAVGEQSNPLSTEVEVIRSVPMLQKTINQLKLKGKEGKALKINDFLANLNVINIRGTDVLTVSYKDQNPQITAAVVNTLINLYIENNQTVNRMEAAAARDFLEKQLPQAEAALRQAEAALRKFKEQNKVVVLPEEAKSAVEVIAKLEEQIAVAKSQYADINAQKLSFEKELQMNPKQGLTATSLSQSSAVQEALKEYQQTERQLAIEAIRFQPTHPVIVDLKNKKETLQALLKARIETVVGEAKLNKGNLQIGDSKPRLIEEFVKVEAKRQGLANQIVALSNVQMAYKQRMNVLPRLEKEQRELENKLQVSQSTYALLFQKLQEIRITENQNVGNARIIEAPEVPEEPITSRKKLFIVSGVLLGSLLAIATALVLESLDKSLKTVEEAKECFGLTLLGVIPALKKPDKVAQGNFFWKDKPNHKDLERPTPKIVVTNDLHTPISAAYRMLQANLRFLSSDKELNTIVVSSSVPQEGKSTVSANLAVAVAQVGRKVLLVDADMHHPVQHRIWDLTNQVGLSNAIVGQAELRMAIREVMPNLDVLTCGVIPPNPMALLDSQRISSLIDEFTTLYDLVIIDTPSLNVAAEALILGKKADGLLFVVRPGVVDSASATFAKELLEKSNQNVLGLVVNGVIPNHEPHSCYYFANESYSDAENLTDVFADKHR